MILALILGTVLSIVALGYVLAPLVVGVKRQTRAAPAISAPPENTAIAALREIEFDRATGKLSDADYASLREKYASEALADMRRSPALTPDLNDPVEAAIRAYRGTHPSCGKCGIRPESDAIYCSNCGSYLPGKCSSCGVTVTVSGVRFCFDCGTRLAA
jgi:hypothetical protein